MRHFRTVNLGWEVVVVARDRRARENFDQHMLVQPRPPVVSALASDSRSEHHPRKLAVPKQAKARHRRRVRLGGAKVGQLEDRLFVLDSRRLAHRWVHLVFRNELVRRARPRASPVVVLGQVVDAVPKAFQIAFGVAQIRGQTLADAEVVTGVSTPSAASPCAQPQRLDRG